MGGGGMVKWWESLVPRSLPNNPPPLNSDAFTPRGGRLLASVRNSPPPVEVGRRPPGGGGFLGGGLAAEEGLPRGLASRC